MLFGLDWDYDNPTPNNLMRKELYCDFLFWSKLAPDKKGKRNKITLCMMKLIRNRYPSTNGSVYAGFCEQENKEKRKIAVVDINKRVIKGLYWVPDKEGEWKLNHHTAEFKVQVDNDNNEIK